MNSPVKIILTSLVVFLSPVTGGSNEGPTKIILKGNRFILAESITAEKSHLRYRTQDAGAEALLGYDMIEVIEWKEPEVWSDILKLAEAKKFDDAIPRLKQVLKAPVRFTNYPAPGNFSTRARGLLVELYRAQMDAENLADEMKILSAEIHLLPPSERRLHDSIPAWVAAAEEAWQTVFSEAKKFPGNSDIAYLEGLGLMAANNSSRAEFAFTKAYSLESGANTAVAREALRQSILLKPTAIKIHTYATVFGRGKLWDQAPASLIALLDLPLSAGESALGEDKIKNGAKTFKQPGESAKRLEGVK